MNINLFISYGLMRMAANIFIYLIINCLQKQATKKKTFLPLYMYVCIDISLLPNKSTRNMIT